MWSNQLHNSHLGFYLALGTWQPLGCLTGVAGAFLSPGSKAQEDTGEKDQLHSPRTTPGKEPCNPRPHTCTRPCAKLGQMSKSYKLEVLASGWVVAILMYTKAA